MAEVNSVHSCIFSYHDIAAIDFFPIKDIIEAFFLNVGMITVCMAFGVVIGSFIIGNVIIDNGKLSNLLHFG